MRLTSRIVLFSMLIASLIQGAAGKAAQIESLQLVKMPLKQDVFPDFEIALSHKGLENTHFSCASLFTYGERGGILVIHDEHGHSRDISNFAVEILIKTNYFNSSDKLSAEMERIRRAVQKTTPASAWFEAAGIFSAYGKYYGFESSYISIMENMLGSCRIPTVAKEIDPASGSIEFEFKDGYAICVTVIPRAPKVTVEDDQPLLHQDPFLPEPSHENSPLDTFIICELKRYPYKEQREAYLKAPCVHPVDDDFNEGILHRAAYYSDTDTAAKALDHSLFRDHIDSRSINLRTALHIACSRGCTSMVKLLLLYGADQKIADTNNNSPLHTACVRYGQARTEAGNPCENWFELVQALLDAPGAREILLRKNNIGHTPLDAARSKQAVSRDWPIYSELTILIEKMERMKNQKCRRIS